MEGGEGFEVFFGGGLMGKGEGGEGEGGKEGLEIAIINFLSRVLFD